MCIYTTIVAVNFFAILLNFAALAGLHRVAGTRHGAGMVEILTRRRVWRRVVVARRGGRGRYGGLIRASIPGGCHPDSRPAQIHVSEQITHMK
jgi:hypothetical protein